MACEALQASGPWAVALSDGDTILAVHDPTGIMPLYWAQLSDGGVAVSDHLPTLVLSPRAWIRRWSPTALRCAMPGAATLAGSA